VCPLPGWQLPTQRCLKGRKGQISQPDTSQFFFFGYIYQVFRRIF
jgi:hypothetical protein